MGGVPGGQAPARVRRRGRDAGTAREVAPRRVCAETLRRVTRAHLRSGSERASVSVGCRAYRYSSRYPIPTYAQAHATGSCGYSC